MAVDEMHLFCVHHAGGTTASFAAWRIAGVSVTKLGYRGRNYASVAEASEALLAMIEAKQPTRFALYGHSLGAILAFEVALRLQHSGRIAHLFVAAAHAPGSAHGGNPEIRALAESLGAAKWPAQPSLAELFSARATQITLEDLALLTSYSGGVPAGQVTVPATVLYSTDDPIVPDAESTRWAAWFARAPRVVEVSGGGHLFHRTRAEAVVRLVQETLSSGLDSSDAAPRTSRSSAETD